VRIPDDTIETIRTQANIVSVIGTYVQLRKSGRNYVGLCPFHKEKTPSFNVNVERGIYKCFGCGRAGNVITFVEEHLHLTFPDAVRHLAAQLGIVIPDDTDDDKSGVGAKRDVARKALLDAAQFFCDTLESSDGAPARAFYSSRGFSPEIIKLFTLGAAPASWDALHTFLSARGFTDEHLEDAGLIIRRDDGSVYDRFRGRAMFTIRDDAGRIVGFSARSITADSDSPKYINSPQGIVFDKSRVLYGLDIAKPSIVKRRTAFIVEGQIDVISMHQHGFSQAVASSGTSLTVEQLRILKRMAGTVVLIFDADSAGQKAMSRGIESALAEGFDVKCVLLPSGEDPDSFLAKNSAMDLRDLIDSASPWMEYQICRFREEGALNDSVKQTEALKTILSWISRVPDELRKPFLVKELALEFQIEEHYLLKQLGIETTRPRASQTSLPAPYNSNVRTTPEVGLLPSEKELIKIALTESHGLALIVNHFGVEATQFVSTAGKRIFERITIAEQEHHDVAQQLASDPALTDDERYAVKDLLALATKPSIVWRKFEVEVPEFDVRRLVHDSILRLREYGLQKEIELLSRQQQAIDDFDEAQRIALQLQRLIELKHRITLKLHSPPSESPADDDLLWLEENNNLVS
jgi:DNA primase